MYAWRTRSTGKFSANISRVTITATPLGLFTPSMRQPYACPRDEAWLAAISRRRLIESRSHAILHRWPPGTHIAHIPLSSRLVCSDPPWARDRKKVNRAGLPRSLNDKWVDSDFPRDYVVLSDVARCPCLPQLSASYWPNTCTFLFLN